jgi:hypothetical protein
MFAVNDYKLDKLNAITIEVALKKSSPDIKCKNIYNLGEFHRKEKELCLIVKVDLQYMPII